MAQSLTYREVEAPEPLRRHVRCVWRLQLDAGSGHIETVYPDGCCELIAHRKTPMYAHSVETGWQLQERCVFAAQQRSAIRLTATVPATTAMIPTAPTATGCAIPATTWMGRTAEPAVILETAA